MDDYELQISIPADHNGFVLLQCSICGDFFKLTPSVIDSPTLLDLHCPYCGLIPDSCMTEDVITLAQAMALNIAQSIIDKELHDWGNSNGLVQMNSRHKHDQEPELPIKAGIEALTIVSYGCCHIQAKIKPMMKFSSSCCPFCGVKHFGDE